MTSAIFSPEIREHPRCNEIYELLSDFECCVILRPDGYIVINMQWDDLITLSERISNSGVIIIYAKRYFLDRFVVFLQGFQCTLKHVSKNA